MTKTDCYARLAQSCATFVATDLYLMATDEDEWQRLWAIDQWLYEYREDDRVGVAQYQRNCDRLFTAYDQARTRMEGGEAHVDRRTA